MGLVMQTFMIQLNMGTVSNNGTLFILPTVERREKPLVTLSSKEAKERQYSSVM